jgi:hypothetical protein
VFARRRAANCGDTRTAARAPCVPSLGTQAVNAPIAKVLWLFYLSKVLDFMDTFFIIMKKNWKQLTFLHVYHHSTIFAFYWLNLNAGYDGDIFLTVILNGLIHTVMCERVAVVVVVVAWSAPRWEAVCVCVRARTPPLSIESPPFVVDVTTRRTGRQEENAHVCVGVTSLPRDARYTYYFVSLHTRDIWWKKYLTMCQMFQFGCMNVQAVYLLGTGCKQFPPRLTALYFVYIVSMFGLFAHFFVQSYTKPKAQKKVA